MSLRNHRHATRFTLSNVIVCVSGVSFFGVVSIHRHDFAIDSSRSIDTALAPPPSCPPLPRIPLRKCISGERAFSDVTHIQIRVHARTNVTRADGAELYGERKVRPREEKKREREGEYAWGTPVSTSIKSGFRGPGLIFCLVSSPSIGTFSTTSSHVLESEMRAAIFPSYRPSSSFDTITLTNADEILHKEKPADALFLRSLVESLKRKFIPGIFIRDCKSFVRLFYGFDYIVSNFFEQIFVFQNRRKLRKIKILLKTTWQKS